MRRAAVAEWQRVSPIAIVFFVVKGIPQLVNLWPALVPILAGGEWIRSFALSYGLYLLGLLVVLGCVLPYWFFRYRIEADHIQLRSGVLHRKHLTLYFDRVQQADISQPFYFRPFGLAVLGLESAGSTQQEVDIPGLSAPQAERLKATILAFRDSTEQREGSSGEDQSQEGISRPDFELHLPWREVARYGLMHNGLILLFPLLVSLMQHWLPGIDDWVRSLEGTQLHSLLLALEEQHAAVLLAVLGTGAAIAGLASVYAISVGIALVRYWDYRLTRYDDQYQYRAGLTTVKTRGFRLHKLQLVTLTQGIVARLLNRCSITISKAGGTGGAQDPTQKRFLVPVLDPGAWRALGEQLELPSRVSWRRVSPLYIAVRSVIWGGFLALAGALLLWINQNNPAAALLALPLTVAIVWRRWRCLGFHYDRQWLSATSGFIGRKVQWLPIVKTQKIAVTQPPWLRLFGMSNLYLWGADGIIVLPYLPLNTAETLRDYVLMQVADSHKPWM